MTRLSQPCASNSPRAFSRCLPPTRLRVCLNLVGLPRPARISATALMGACPLNAQVREVLCFACFELAAPGHISSPLAESRFFARHALLYRRLCKRRTSFFSLSLRDVFLSSPSLYERRISFFFLSFVDDSTEARLRNVLPSGEIYLNARTLSS